MAEMLIKETFQVMYNLVITHHAMENMKLRSPVTFGEVFQEVCDQVTQAMEKNKKLKPVLGFLETTLNSMRDEVSQGHHNVGNDNLILEMLHTKAMLIVKASKLTSWHNFFLDEHTDSILYLDWFLRTGHLQLAGNKLRLYEESIMGYYLLVLNNEQPTDETRRRSLMHTLLKTKTTTAEEKEKEAALLVFLRLFEALIKEDKEEKAPDMMRRLLMEIKCNMALWLVSMQNKPMEEVTSFGVEMEKGLEVVRRSCS